MSIIRKAGNVLFNDALNTFYLQLYDVGRMVKVSIIMTILNFHFRGDVIRIGICFPKNVDSFQVTQKIFEKEDMFSVTSIKDLDDDTTGKAWFWDSNSG